MGKKWTEEEDNLLKAGVMELPGRTLSAIRTRRRNKGLCKPQANTNLTDEELLNLVRKYQTHNAMAYSRDQSDPSPKIVVTRFGSWEKAAQLAGLDRQVSGVRPDRETWVYLVKIQDFYKIGVTQGDVLSRFKVKGIKEVTVLDSVKMGNLGEALELEAELLNLVKPFKFRAPISEGFTECFRLGMDLGQLEQLYSTLF